MAGTAGGRPEVAVEFCMTPAQRDELKNLAQLQGVSVQELLELKVFGSLRPRLRRRRRNISPEQERLIA